jgi:hypothetical protein
MTTIYAIHKPDAEKLQSVISEMRTLGAPTIEVVDCGEYFQALEGSHRLAAAAELGLEPVLTVHEQDDMIDITRFDWYQEDPQNWAETEYMAGEVAGEIFSPRYARSYSFGPR